MEDLTIVFDSNLLLLKEQGDKKYGLKNYHDAVLLYSKGIERATIASNTDFLVKFCNNRSLAHIACCNYRLALVDIEQCEKLDSTYKKGTHRRLQCLTMLGELVSARSLISQREPSLPDDPLWEKAVNEYEEVHSVLNKIKQCMKSADYKYAIYFLKQLYSRNFRGTAYYVAYGECLLEMGEYVQAEQQINYIFLDDPSTTNPDALYIRGRCLYFIRPDQLQMAHELLKRSAYNDPDHEKARFWSKNVTKIWSLEKDALEKMQSCSYSEAYQLYISLTNSVKTNVKLYCRLLLQQTIAAFKGRRFREGIRDANTLMVIEPNNIEALKYRAQCYENIQNWEMCYNDANLIYSLEPFKRNYSYRMKIFRLMNPQGSNSFFVRPSTNSSEHYKTLGVGPNATIDEIKKAYKQLTLMYHPDKNLGKSPEVIEANAKMFLKISEAYRVLTS